MKEISEKEKFIMRRAEGLSYSGIAAELNISKSTCSRWERELKGRIQAQREENQRELCSLYRMGREAHIKRLGEALNGIEEALSKKDLAEIPADKLLKLKLEYERELWQQCSDPAGGDFSEYSDTEILQALGDTYKRLRAGQITASQAKAEISTLEGLQRAKSAKDSSDFYSL